MLEYIFFLCDIRIHLRAFKKRFHVETCQWPIFFQKLLNTNTSPSSSPPKIPINILIRIPSRRPFNQDYALSRLSNWQKGVDPRKGKLTALSWFRGMETVERNVTVVWSKRFVHTVEGNPVLFSAKTRIVSKGRKRRQRGREGKRERETGNALSCTANVETMEEE